jgi:predicted transcriptional regulator of viral defense system
MLAAAQHGVFARQHAIDLGLTDAMIHRRVRVGRWERLFAGVYRVSGSQPTWRQLLLATCLAWGPGTVGSHRSAAALRRLSGFASGVVELTVPRDRRRRSLAGIVHRPRSLPPVDIETVDAIPVTTVARTLLDVAGVVDRDVVEWPSTTPCVGDW